MTLGRQPIGCINTGEPQNWCIKKTKLKSVSSLTGAICPMFPERLWYILEDGKIKSATIEEWSVWFNDVENRRIDYTEEEDFCVSTVFLGMDHGLGYSEKPLLFETLIQKGPKPLQDKIYRYSTMGEAKAGHYALVRMLRGAEYDFDSLGEPSIMNLFFELMEDAAKKEEEEKEEKNDAPFN